MRKVVVGAAQMGPNQKTDTREAIVTRMVALLDQATDGGADLVVYPELALTTFFPRWYHEDRAAADGWFETEVPNAATQPLFDRGKERNVAISFGYAEKTPEGRHFNTSILVDKDGTIVGKYRKVHLPGHVEYEPESSHQRLEKRYFEPGDIGFPAWRTMGGIFGMAICNDRRWPETYRVLGLQAVEMVLIGYNTPSQNQRPGTEGADKRLFHHRLSVQAGAYQNSTWAVAVAKAGVEDGHHLIGGTLIVNPHGEIVAEAKTERDELLIHECDLDETAFGKATIFDFGRHRRVEHYGLIASQGPAIPPPEAAESESVLDRSFDELKHGYSHTLGV
ncbi:N-carbamoyl-D-amino-acid hydrolase [Bradyrhizobium sp. LTSP857]|uniref:N-carbamoyl-D-amino-acid hydrolase n=1 Tax=Bradyrhizobium sp. LTSP857 TaxID=1619231 RepID=UPI0009E50DC1|nr:N-carbamoyl-D-amino-acid hydrolase [Bradyrhizobium sp. LTSP857]